MQKVAKKDVKLHKVMQKCEKYAILRKVKKFAQSCAKRPKVTQSCARLQKVAQCYAMRPKVTQSCRKLQKVVESHELLQTVTNGNAKLR